MADNEKKFETVQRYAKPRHVSAKQIYKLIEDPNSGFPHLRYGRRIVIPIADADEWARAHASAKAKTRNK